MRKKNTNFRMNFPSPLHLIAGGDDYRSQLAYIQFRNGYAYVTDANTLIRQSFTLFSHISGYELLEGKYLHKNIFARIYAEKLIFITPEGIKIPDGGGNDILYSFSTYFNSDDVEENLLHRRTVNIYPNSEVVISGALENIKETCGLSKFSLNPAYLQRLHKAMATNGGTSLIFHLPKTNSQAIVLQTIDYPLTDQLALIMPSFISHSSDE